jgi:hypothetical protein
MTVVKIKSIQTPSETGWSWLVNYLIDNAEIKKNYVSRLYINNYIIRSKNSEKGENFFIINQNLIDLIPKNSVIKIELYEESLNTNLCSAPVASVEANIKGALSDESINSFEVLGYYFAQKYTVDHWGSISRQFGDSDDRKRSHVRLFELFHELIWNEFSFQSYLVGGSLLGIVRENKLLDHDDDLDMAVYIGNVDYMQINPLFYEIHDFLQKIIKEKYSYLIIKMNAPCHIGISWAEKDVYVDIFPAWIDTKLNYNRFSGVGGYWGSSEIKFIKKTYLDSLIVLPEKFELELDITYGVDKWRKYDPNFSWFSSTEVQQLKDYISFLGFDEFILRYPTK